MECTSWEVESQWALQDFEGWTFLGLRRVNWGRFGAHGVEPASGQYDM